MDKKSGEEYKWTPSSWRKYPIVQQPKYKDQKEVQKAEDWWREQGRWKAAQDDKNYESLLKQCMTSTGSSSASCRAALKNVWYDMQ